MRFKVTHSRPGGAYLVEREGRYCLVNLRTGRYNEAKEIGAFLKLGWFSEIEGAEPAVLEAIAAILDDPARRLEIN